MSFESGSISCRVFSVPRELPDDLVSRFAAQAALPLSSLKDEPLQGWVGGRHLLDRVITDDNAYYAGFLRLILVQAERKIPPALLKAEQTMEELAQLQATGAPFLNRKVRSEIKEEVVARLLPQMPPILKGIVFVHDRNERLVYATALSEKQLDAFQIAFARAAGFALIPMTPDAVAMIRQKVDVSDWSGASFSPDLDDRDVQNTIGEDFLTWLWYISESGHGSLPLDGEGEVGVLIEGPLTFYREGEGAHLTVLRKGSPLISAEAKTALMSGKKLKSARLHLAQGEDTWTCTLDAEQFVFRGLKLPESEEKLDPLSRFQERMRQLDHFLELFMGLYDHFLARRGDESAWRAEIASIRQWVTDRKTAQ